MAHLYILELSDKTHYCGITMKLFKRILAHGKGECKSTRKKRPQVLKMIMKYENMKEARQMEVRIKAQGVTRWYEKNKHSIEYKNL